MTRVIVLMACFVAAGCVTRVDNWNLGNGTIRGFGIGPNGTPTSLAQTTGVEMGGNLVAVELQLNVFGKPTEPVEVEVRTLTNGVPDDSATALLGSGKADIDEAAASSPSVGEARTQIVALNTPIALQKGDKIAIVVKSQNPATHPVNALGWYDATGNHDAFRSGVGFMRSATQPWRELSGGSDFLFKTLFKRD